MIDNEARDGWDNRIGRSTSISRHILDESVVSGARSTISGASSAIEGNPRGESTIVREFDVNGYYVEGSSIGNALHSSNSKESLLTMDTRREPLVET
ncbi:hypothetical protein ACH5RR_037093 [Cinchona calisaya]|uniref:Uncharacterized protein n=1 Tax=Cinchona calisaya TaxID=153742 RepID=A0ABD2Y8T1_9GENT